MTMSQYLNNHNSSINRFNRINHLIPFNHKVNINNQFYNNNFKESNKVPIKVNIINQFNNSHLRDSLFSRSIKTFLMHLMMIHNQFLRLNNRYPNKSINKCNNKHLHYRSIYWMLISSHTSHHNRHNITNRSPNIK